MAIQTQQGSAAFGCYSPDIGVQNFVTNANAASSALTTTDAHTVLHSSMSFRAGGSGALYTFDELLFNSAYNINGSVTIPGAGTSTGHNWSGSFDVKRPVCECTPLYKFYGRATTTGTAMKAITFEDGYYVEVGAKVVFMRVDQTSWPWFSFVKANNLSVGDQIIKCGYPGSGQGQVGTSCTLISAKSNVTRTGKFVQALETYWPQDQDGAGSTFAHDLSGSEIRGALQLENGVYIFFIPNGGNY